jgi:hypothetical protein
VLPAKAVIESPTAVEQILSAVTDECTSTVTTSDSGVTSPTTAVAVDVEESCSETSSSDCSNHNSNNNSKHNNGRSHTSCSSSSSDCSTLGVRLIWVAEHSRRQGIATRLVDSARACFAYGEIIERRKVAFSQPTREGFVFASKYCGTMSVLSYC